MLFDEEFLSSLPDEPVIALEKICNHFLIFHESIEDNDDALEKYDLFIEAYALIQSISSALEINIPLKIPGLTDDREKNIYIIWNFYSELKTSAAKEAVKIITNTSLNRSSAVFDGFFGKRIMYEFSDGDLDRIQELIDKLRSLVTKSKSIGEEHKSRLLKKLEQLQSELQKRISDLDRFYGFISEAGIALGKFGEDAKPFFDMIQEIVQIAWRSQARAEELPSGFGNKLLSEKDPSGLD